MRRNQVRVLVHQREELGRNAVGIADQESRRTSALPLGQPTNFIDFGGQEEHEDPGALDCGSKVSERIRVILPGKLAFPRESDCGSDPLGDRLYGIRSPQIGVSSRRDCDVLK